MLLRLEHCDACPCHSIQKAAAAATHPSQIASNAAEAPVALSSRASSSLRPTLKICGFVFVVFRVFLRGSRAQDLGVPASTSLLHLLHLIGGMRFGSFAFLPAWVRGVKFRVGSFESPVLVVLVEHDRLGEMRGLVSRVWGLGFGVW